MSGFSRPFKLDAIPGDGRDVAIEADEGEMAAVAMRLGLEAVQKLTAKARLTKSGEEVRAVGRVAARIEQRCAVTDVPLHNAIDEPFDIAFRPEVPADPDEEIELSAGECDVVFYEGGAVDLGVAAADTLALALDPYPRAPGADEALKAAGVLEEGAAGPLARALAGLKK